MNTHSLRTSALIFFLTLFATLPLQAAAITAYQEPFLRAILQAHRIIAQPFPLPLHSTKQELAKAAAARKEPILGAFNATDDPVLKMAIRFIWFLRKEACKYCGKELEHISLDGVPMSLFVSCYTDSTLNKKTICFDCSFLPDEFARDASFIQLALDIFATIIDTQPDLLDGKSIKILELLGGPMDHEFTITSSFFGWYKKPF
jgi:hypothetical protein